MGNGNHTLKMADTDNFPEIIDDNRKRTRLLHNLYGEYFKLTVDFYFDFGHSSEYRL